MPTSSSWEPSDHSFPSCPRLGCASARGYHPPVFRGTMLPTLHAYSLFWWIPVSSNVQAYLFVNSLAKLHVPSEWFPHTFIVLLSKDILFYMVIICLYLSHSSLKVLSTLKCPDDQFFNIPLVNPMLCSCRHWIKALGGQKGQTLSKKQKSFWLELL